MTPALCAVHPEVPATATCARCGRFFCAACQGADQPLLCTEWVVLWMDPLGILRSPLDLGAVLKNGMQMLSPVIGKVAVLTLVYSAPLVLFLAWMPPDGGGAMWTSFRMTSLYNLLAGTFCTIACTCLFVGAAEGHRLTMGASLAEASARYGRVISTRIRTSLWTSLFLIALIVPGVWKGITLVFSIEAAVRLRKGDPLEQSANLVRGRWWKVFGLWFCIQAVALTTTGALRLGSELLLETSAPSILMVLRFVEEWAAAFIEAAGTACLLAMFYAAVNTAGQRLEPMRWREPQKQR